MGHYIDKDTLVAEIENRIKELQNLHKEDEEKLDSIQKTAILLCIDECKVILKILDTLEGKEVDLDVMQRMEECPHRWVACTMYKDKILKCKGDCSWVIDY